MSDILADSSNLTDMNNLRRETNKLMLCYCQTIESCKTVPALSILPVFTLFWHLFRYYLCIYITLLLLPLTLLLLVARAAFGHPQRVFGGSLRAYLAKPWRIAWTGEMPLFKVIRFRYLTSLVVYYGIQSRITTLQNAFNRRHLYTLARSPTDTAALSVTKQMQESFDTFAKIAKDSYTFRAIAVGGPVIAGLSLLTEKVALPAAGYVTGKAWAYIAGGSQMGVAHFLSTDVLFIYSLVGVWIIWTLASAWMDARILRMHAGSTEKETAAYMASGIELRRRFRLTCLCYFAIIMFWAIMIGMSSIRSLEDVASRPTGHIDPTFAYAAYFSIALNVAVIVVLLCLGLVAICRRLYLSRKRAAREKQGGYQAEQAASTSLGPV